MLRVPLHESTAREHLDTLRHDAGSADGYFITIWTLRRVHEAAENAERVAIWRSRWHPIQRIDAETEGPLLVFHRLAVAEDVPAYARRIGVVR